MSNTKNPLSYKSAGVNIESGYALVDAIKPLAKATHRAGALGALGGFGALFDLKATGFKDPILVSGTDGVGTKLMLAFKTGRHETIGIDLVAMCVNDVLAQGAEPLFFLDYFATGTLQPEAAKAVIAGIASGCQQAGCALIGGETAEMPGMYAPGHYDLAGFVLGAVERDHLLPRHGEMQAGDQLIGLASSGPHSNGYSLIRKCVERSGLDYQDAAPFDAATSLGEALLTPTRLYPKLLLPVLKAGLVHGLAHITGGGLFENVPRMCPAHLKPALSYESWAVPSVFQWLQETGQIETAEMHKTFNMGLGMVLAVSKANLDPLMTLLGEMGEAPSLIGELVDA